MGRMDAGNGMVLPGALAVVLIVSTVAFALSAFPVTQPSSSSTTSGFSTDCSVAYSASLIRGSASNTSALVFATNSTAEACVAVYAIGGNMSWSGPPEYEMLENGEFVPAVNLSVTYSPSPISVTAGGVGLYVFQFKPGNDTRAIYEVGLPFGCWTPDRLLAVGYSIAQLQSMNLTLPLVFYSCPAFEGGTQLIGITNLTPTYTK